MTPEDVPDPIGSVDPMASQARAPRLPLRAPITFLSPRGVAWAEGWTVNISRTGVLFEQLNAPHPAHDFTGDLSFVIKLSRGAMAGPGVAFLPDLHCTGEIARIAEGASGQPILAVTIRHQSMHTSEQPI